MLTSRSTLAQCEFIRRRYLWQFTLVCLLWWSPIAGYIIIMQTSYTLQETLCEEKCGYYSYYWSIDFKYTFVDLYICSRKLSVLSISVKNQIYLSIT